jgi:toxin CptA
MAHSYWHHFLRLSHHAVLGLNVTRDGLKIETRRDGWIPAEILGSSFVSPWLTVLNLKLPHRRLATHVVLLPDMLGADEFRRLRVWLRWGDALTHGKDSDAVL